MLLILTLYCIISCFIHSFTHFKQLLFTLFKQRLYMLSLGKGEGGRNGKNRYVSWISQYLLFEFYRILRLYWAFCLAALSETHFVWFSPNGNLYAKWFSDFFAIFKCIEIIWCEAATVVPAWLQLERGEKHGEQWGKWESYNHQVAFLTT